MKTVCMKELLEVKLKARLTPNAELVLMQMMHFEEQFVTIDLDKAKTRGGLIKTLEREVTSGKKRGQKVKVGVFELLQKNAAGEVFLSFADFKRASGLPERTFYRALAELCKLGFLVKKSHSAPNKSAIYAFTLPVKTPANKKEYYMYKKNNYITPQSDLAQKCLEILLLNVKKDLALNPLETFKAKFTQEQRELIENFILWRKKTFAGEKFGTSNELFIWQYAYDNVVKQGLNLALSIKLSQDKGWKSIQPLFRPKNARNEPPKEQFSGTERQMSLDELRANGLI